MPRESIDWQRTKAGAREAMIGVARRGVTITYSELLAAIGHPDGLDDLARLLREISLEEDAAGRGLLTAVVVRSAGGLPGNGFFQLAVQQGRDIADRESCWRAEHERLQHEHA